MNLAYAHLLPADFVPTSRVWIYQATRLYSLAEALAIEERIEQFTNQWQSHGQPVKGKGFLFFGQFVILMADTTMTQVSGCSTDSSVALIKKIEQEFSTPLLDRTQCAMCHVPCAICHVPYAMCHMPCAMCHVPCAMCHLPCAMCHVPCALRHAPCAMRHAPCAMLHAPCTMHHAP